MEFRGLKLDQWIRSDAVTSSVWQVCVCVCVCVYTYIKRYLFIRWAGSSLLHQPFSSCGEQRLLSSCSAQFLFLAASLVGTTGYRALGLQQLRNVGSVVVTHGLSYPEAGGIYPLGPGIQSVSCIGRWVLYH